MESIRNSRCSNAKRTQFAKTLLARIAVDNALPSSILWWHEVHFTLDAALNILAHGVLIASPNNMYEQSMNPDNITLWSSFTVYFILCPFFRRTPLRVLKDVPLVVPVTATFIESRLSHSDKSECV